MAFVSRQVLPAPASRRGPCNGLAVHIYFRGRTCWYGTNVVNRLAAILLFAAFLLPFAVPALSLGQAADAGLPACCRRTGAHHCAMSPGEQTKLLKHEVEPQGTARWRAPMERCPYLPACPGSFHANALLALASAAAFAVFFSHPSGVVQTESRWRMARDRSRQMRGPPVTLQVS